MPRRTSLLPDGSVFVPVSPAIAHADDRSVRQANAPRSLDLEKEQLHRVIDPSDLEAPALQNARRLDLGPAEPSPLAQFGRHAIDRMAEAAGSGA
jgi:hypothetical protein